MAPIEDCHIELRPHFAIEVVDGPAGRREIPIEHDQYMVYLVGEPLRVSKHRFRNDKGELQVGWISKRPGANFCPINATYEFHTQEIEWFAAEAKRQHGSASSEPHVDVPPPLPEDEEEFETSSTDQ